MKAFPPIITLSIYWILYFLFIASKGTKQKNLEENELDTTENSFYSNSDLFLRETKLTYDLRKYQIDNREKNLFGMVNVFLNSSDIQSIELYSAECNKEPSMTAVKNQDSEIFLLTDNNSPVGYLSLESKGLMIKDLDMSIKASFKESFSKNNDTLVEDIITLNIPSCHSYKTKQFVIKGANNNELGKYYLSLRNIDLTSDIRNELDRRLAIIAAIIIDSESVRRI